ncbi:MAG: DUF1476 domain-containing protein [Alphaproteobacteria bacterium]|nr:MAG: DUF1476 domain-containing protein [Alphaproteobacteria bacterium]
MDNFQKRLSAFEAKFQHDQEMIFRVSARMVKFFGLWAAEQMKLGEDEAKAYAQHLVEFDLDEPGFQDVIGKVQKDLPGVSESRLWLELGRCHEEALESVEAADSAATEAV